MTALEAERRGESVAPLAPHALQAAYWKSARDGLDGDAIDLTRKPRVGACVDLLDGLVDRVRPALEAVGRLRHGAHRARRASPSTATVRCDSDGRGGAGMTSPTFSPRPRAATLEWTVRPAAARRTPGWSAAPNRCRGSTVNASVLRDAEIRQHRGGRRRDRLGVHRSRRLRTAVADQPHLVDGARLRRRRRCSSPARPRPSRGRTPASRCRRPGSSPDTVRTSGAANTCSAVDVGSAAGRSAMPTPSAPSPIASTAAAARIVVRQRIRASSVGSWRTGSSADGRQQPVAHVGGRLDSGRGGR